MLSTSSALFDIDTATEVVVLDATGADAARWLPLVANGETAGETFPLIPVADTAAVRVEKVSLWRHSGGTLPYGRPTSAELIHLIEGRVEISADGGATVEIAAGQSALVPFGFTGTWRTVEPVFKLSLSLIPTNRD